MKLHVFSVMWLLEWRDMSDYFGEVFFRQQICEYVGGCQKILPPPLDSLDGQQLSLPPPSLPVTVLLSAASKGLSADGMRCMS